jgi:polysaccharide export outer membrane protein
MRACVWSGRMLALSAVAAMVVGAGCAQRRNAVLQGQMPLDHGIPRELCMTSLPVYRIEPPDILLIDAVKVVPKDPYHIEPFDTLQIVVTGTPDEPTEQIAGIYRVESNGRVALGPSYGTVKVLDMTLEEAAQAIRQHLERIIIEPGVSVTLAEPAAKQQIAGEHLVTPDGTVNLGIYGSVYVTGMTIREARAAIEDALTEFLEEPEVSVDVLSYNSKVYYIIVQGAGLGDQVLRIPVTGNERVLDAVSQLGGFQTTSSTTMWVARPAPEGLCAEQILPIDWHAITQGASVATNYQMMPGDRLYVAEDKLVAFDTFINKAISPFERMIGFTLLGTQTLQTINRFPAGNFSNSAQNFATGT